MTSSQPSPLAGTLQRACDQCNARKIRCDKLQPCSHCRAADLTCRTTLQRPKQQRDRVMVSKQYENKIDRIEARLASIERLLQERLPTPSQGSAPSKVDASMDPVIEVDGYTGPHADSLAAKEAFEQVAGVSPVTASNESLNAALSSLRGSIDRIKGDEHTSTSNDSNSKRLSLPSWEDVQPILREVDGDSAPVFQIYFPCLDTATFRRKCQYLYQNEQNGPIFDRLLVYACLSSLCFEFSGTREGAESEHNHAMSQSFKQHLLRTIDVLPAIQTASWDGIEALSAAAFACLEMCKPQLGLTLSSIAARFCQTLGYNRLALSDSTNEPEKQRKIFMFWQVYVYDRNTALRVGRPPTIPEYDVSAECLDARRFTQYLPAVVDLNRYWAQVADVQGAISSKLYSPVGMRQSFEQRSRLVKILVTKLQSAWSSRNSINDSAKQLFASMDPTSLTAQCIDVGDEIAYYSTLTVVYHALSPPGQPTSDTIEAARACLRAYKTIRPARVDNAYSWVGFCHCVLLYSPLTPFTVLFTHVINDHANGYIDLQLLNDFADGLKPARQVSETVDRFHSLCSMFCQIAEAYIAAKSQEAVMTEFDDYLSTLGLLPQTTAFDNTSDMNGASVAMSTNYQDWYTGNVSLYGLIGDENSIGNLEPNFGLH